MATIRAYTTIEQSRKLAEILSNESADNVIVSFGSRDGVKTVVMPKETLDVIRTPFADIRETTICWSLAALISILPLPDLIQDKADNELFWQCSVYHEDGTLLCETYDNNPIDACYEMIIKLHEQNLL